MSEIRRLSEHDWRNVRYAQQKFSLRLEDLEQFPRELDILLSCEGSYETFDEAVKNCPQLLVLSLRNAYKTIGYNVDDLAESGDLEDLALMVRARIGSTFETMKSYLKALHPSEVEVLSPEMINAFRREATITMDERYGHLFALWSEAEHGLSDAELSEYFMARGPVGTECLSTYFDSARVGLVNVPLRDAVDGLAHRIKKNWVSFKERMQETIVSAVDPEHGNIEKQRFFADNCFFRFNGTEAFMLYRQTFMEEGNQVLATDEEYSENIEDMETNGIQVDRIPVAEDQIHFLHDLRARFQGGEKYDYILVSDLSRYGNSYPLEAIAKLRDEYSPGTRIIVDACQSAGRRKLDMNSCGADAVILSTTKGADLDQGLGVLLLAGPQPRHEARDLNGSAPPENMTRTAFALNPSAFSDEELNLPGNLKPLILNPEQRNVALRELAEKFQSFVRTINDDYEEEKIEIMGARYDDPVHAFEIKVKGVKRKELCAYLDQYGVFVDPHYMDPADDETIRIAFHPFMNNDSLKILGGVLCRCIDNTSA